MKKLICVSKGVRTMRKALLVILIGMALAINVYGFVKGFMVEEVEQIDHIKETTMTVYME